MGKQKNMRFCLKQKESMGKRKNWFHTRALGTKCTKKTAALPSFKLTVPALWGWLMVAHRDDVHNPCGVLRTPQRQTSVTP